MGDYNAPHLTFDAEAVRRGEGYFVPRTKVLPSRSLKMQNVPHGCIVGSAVNSTSFALTVGKGQRPVNGDRPAPRLLADRLRSCLHLPGLTISKRVVAFCTADGR